MGLSAPPPSPLKGSTTKNKLFLCVISNILLEEVAKYK